MSWFGDRVFDLMAKVNIGQNAYALGADGEKIPVEMPNAPVFQQELAALLGAPVPTTANAPITINYTQPADVPTEVADDTDPTIAPSAALTLNAFNANQEGASDAVALRIRNGVADIPGICPIGTILGLVGATAAQGWSLADGVANSIANGGSGLDCLSKYLKFNTAAGEWGGSGTTTSSGTAAITVSAPNTTTSGATAPGVTIDAASIGVGNTDDATVNVTINSVNSATTGVTISDHSALAHSASGGSLSTNTVGDHAHTTVTINVTAGALAATQSLASAGSHNHTVDTASVAAAIANHTISAHSVNDPGHTHNINASANSTHNHGITDPTHTHTGTVDSHTHTTSHSHTATDAGHTHTLTALQLDRIELVPYERIA